MADPLGLIPTAVGGVAPLAPLRPAGVGAAGDVPSFKEVLMQNLEQVNKLQQEAQTAIEDLKTGRGDPAGVMMAKAKADTAFQMLLQVRNKLMDAYEEIKQIRV